MGRLFRALTRLNRETGLPQFSDGGFFKLLLDVCRADGTPMDSVAMIAAALHRRSPQSCHRFLDLFVDSTRLLDPATEAGDPSSVHRRRILLAGPIRRLHVQLANRLTAGIRHTRYAELLLGVRSPGAVVRLLEAMESGNRTNAHNALQWLLSQVGPTSSWLSGMADARNGAYDLARLLQLLRRFGPRVAEGFARLAQAVLRRVAERDRRTSARGFLLQALARVDRAGAAELAEWLFANDFVEILCAEWSPLRIGHTLASIALVDRARARAACERIGLERLIAATARCENLYALATLIRGVCAAAADPDGLVHAILDEPRSRAALQELIYRCTNAHGLAAITTLMGPAGPLLPSSQKILREYVAPDRFTRLLDDFIRPRHRAELLRAFAVCYPSEAQVYACRVRERIGEAGSSPAARDATVREWIGAPDAGALGQLLLSTNVVDTRLARVIAERQTVANLGTLLKHEPSAGQRAELLRALARSAPDRAAEIVQREFGGGRLREALLAAADLREVNELLGGVRAADRRVFMREVQALHQQDAARLEVLLQGHLQEETNLGVIAMTLRHLGAVVKPLACRLHSLLDLDWTSGVMKRDAALLDAFAFVQTSARLWEDVQGPRLDRVRSLLSEDFLDRISEVRSVRAFVKVLDHAWRIAVALRNAAVQGDIGARLVQSRFRGTIEYVTDIAGLGAASFLLGSHAGVMGSLQRDAWELRDRMDDRVVELAPSSSAPVGLAVLGLTGTWGSGITADVERRLERLEAPELWQFGLIDWAIFQGCAVRGRRAPDSSPLSAATLLFPDPSAMVSHIIANADTNLHLLFALWAVRRGGLVLRGGSYTHLDACVQVRAQWEQQPVIAAALLRVLDGDLDAVKVTPPDTARWVLDAVPGLEVFDAAETRSIEG